MARRKPIELVGFGATKKYECTKGENQHVYYVVSSSGDQIEPGTADKAKQKAWKLDLLPLDIRQCPRPDCTILLRLGPRGGTVRQKAKSLYGAKGKRRGRPRRLGEEEYRYLLCRGSNKKLGQGHGTVAIVVGSVSGGNLRRIVLPPKKAGRPGGPSKETKERIRLTAALLVLGLTQGKMSQYVYPDSSSPYNDMRTFYTRNRPEIGSLSKRLNSNQARRIAQSKGYNP